MSSALKINETKKKILDLDLLSFVSHELKIPLSTLKLNVQILQKQKLQKEKNLIDIMEQEVEWMIQFISDTLDLRKADNKATLNLNWYKWNQWIQNIQTSIKTKINLSGRELNIHPSDQEIEVYMDPLYIRQALFNLILNASEHSSKNSKIEISWEQIENNKLNVHVTDQGLGIKSEDKVKIFEPFYKEREKANCVIKGSGLGLAIVKKIIQAHGGDVYVQNRPDGKGAIFTFILTQTRAISTNSRL